MLCRPGLIQNSNHILNLMLNPITYGILTFRQLRGEGGEGAFWPGSRKQGYS